MPKIKGKQQKTITILWGLPGAGKSTYAQSLYVPYSGSLARTVDMDLIFRTNESQAVKMKKLGNELLRCLQIYNEAVIDGLITTNAQARKIIDYLAVTLSDYQLVFKIVYWKLDRESCLVNDKDRRTKSSKFSIENMPFEIPNVDVLPECAGNNRITAMKTIRKSSMLGLALAAGINKYHIKDMKMYSDTWSLGGSYGSYHDDGVHPVDADDPLEFTELDNLLESIYPDISFLKYKKIKSECCSIEKENHSDYYDGGTTSAKHVCDLNKLHDILIDFNILKEDK